MPSVLLLHGALGSTQQLIPVRSILEDKGCTVFDLNFSGHGGKPFESNFGIEEFAREVDSFIQDNGLNDLILFGYSMGGYVACWLAVQNPGYFPKVVTLGTKFDWSRESAEKEIKKVNPEKIEMKIPAYARILEHRHYPNDWKLLMNKTAVMMNELGERPLLRESNLRTIQSRTIIALGDQDDMADLSYSKQVAGWIPKSKFVSLENTPHPIEKVNHKELCELILS